MFHFLNLTLILVLLCFIQKFQFRYQQTAVCFAEGDNQLFVGGIDNDIKVYDRRTNSIAYQLIGHGDTITIRLRDFFNNRNVIF